MPSLLSFLWQRRPEQSDTTVTPSPARTTTTGSAMTNVTGKKFATQTVSIKNIDCRKSAQPMTILTSGSSSSEDADGTTNTTYSKHHNKQQEVVVTPDGFKPRRSILDIRTDLITIRKDHDENRNHCRTPTATSSSQTYNDASVVSSSAHPSVVGNERNRRVERMASSNSTKASALPTTGSNAECRSIVPIVQQRGNGYDRANESYHIRCGSDNVSWMRVSQNPGLSNNANSSLAVLPPLPIRSWSTQDTTTPVGSMLSSTGRVSFATGTSDGTTIDITPSAESPHLEPGRTRTAVGNLIVSMEHQRRIMDPPGMTPLQDVSHRYTHDTEWEYSPQEHNVETMFSPLLLNHPSIMPKSNAKTNTRTISNLPMISEQPAAIVTNTVTAQSRRSMKHDEESQPSRNNNLKHSRRTISPLASDIHISYGTNNHPPKRRQEQQEFQSTVVNHPSTGTHCAILPYAPSLSNRLHNVGSIENHPTVEEKRYGGYSWTVTSTPTNSSRSGSSAASKKTITSSSNSIVVFDNNHVLLQQNKSNIGIQQGLNATFTDSSIQLRKAKSQNRIKEELIISALERLQDDLQLVSDVERLLQLENNTGSHADGPIQKHLKNHRAQSQSRIQHQPQSSMYDWFVSTPMNMEGILTGFTDTKRYAILDKIDFLIHEYIDANEIDNESQLLPHPSLREALVFCTLLVKMAIPESEKEDSSIQGTEEIGHWRFANELREGIGLSAVDGGSVTPFRGGRDGGDASFFSLPDEDRIDNCDTPMTSNVSIGASTLTTIVKDHHFGDDGMLRPMFGTSVALKQMQQKQYNGLYLRQAIQLFTTGIQKMSVACHQLIDLKGERLNPSSVLKSADMIQKSYLQLLSMNQSDLKSIVDAFEFEICATSFDDEDNESICEVVDDTDDDEPPELKPVNSVESPILFAETLGFGILNATTNHDDLSLDDTGSSTELPSSFYSCENHNHSLSSQHQPTLTLTPQVNVRPVDNVPVDQRLDDDATTNHMQNLKQESQQNRKKSPILTLDTFFSQKSDDNTNHDCNNITDNQSLVSFTPSYKSIRLEI